MKIKKTNAAPHVKVVERGRIFKFLHGLNHECDLTKIEILGRENISIGSVKGKETRRVVMLKGGTSNTMWSKQMKFILCLLDLSLFNGHK